MQIGSLCVVEQSNTRFLKANRNSIYILSPPVIPQNNFQLSKFEFKTSFGLIFSNPKKTEKNYASVCTSAENQVQRRVAGENAKKTTAECKIHA